MMCTKHNAEYMCIAGDINTDFSRADIFYKVTITIY